MKQPNEWSKATRKKGTGGIHLYVPKEKLERALANARIDPSEIDLVIKVHPMKTNWRGRARILIELKVDRKETEIHEQAVCESSDIEEGESDEQRSGSGTVREVREPLSHGEAAEGHGRPAILAQVPAQAGLQDIGGARVVT